jgi:RNA polymerase sigma factor (sigma-70 family)
VTEDQTPGMGSDEVERRDYAAFVDSLTGTLNLRDGLAEALDVADYTAMSSHIASLLDLEAGLQSALAVSTRADAELPLRASAEEATDSVANLLLRIGDGDAAAWDEILRRYDMPVSTTVRSFRLQEADALDAASAVAVSTRADAELPLRAFAEEATDTAALLRAAEQGDKSAWDEIVRRYGGIVSATVRSFRLQDADALDAIQMTWLRLMTNLHRAQDPERLSGWLATTARRECLSILRQSKRTAHHEEATFGAVADPSADPEQSFLAAETVLTLRSLVAELPNRGRVLLQALFSDNPRPYAEIARITRIPVGSLGPTRARALRQLRQLLDERGLRPPELE